MTTVFSSLLRRDLDLGVPADELLDAAPLGGQRALVAPRPRRVRELRSGEDERIRDRHAGRRRNGALERRQDRQWDESPARAEGGPVDGEEALPVEMLVPLGLR